jgi:hypothetical protein
VPDWRRVALVELPELRSIIEDGSWSCHVFLVEVLHLVHEAHRGNDDDTLRRGYGFAQWCFSQASTFLANAATVSFYVHLFDEWELRQAVLPWLPPRIREYVRPMWEWRLPGDRMRELDRMLGADGQQRWREATERASRHDAG